MANPEHLEILKQGIIVWNTWREDYPEIEPDLSSAYLRDYNFQGFNLSSTCLAHADISGADFEAADLSGADLFATDPIGANFNRANLYGANFEANVIAFCSFGDNDLSQTKGLDKVSHYGSSTIGIDTIYKSQGNIPEDFLRGCGVPNEFIAQIPALVAALQPIQFHSCFISYSHKDEEFAHRLYSRMRDAKLRVWYAPEEMKGGQKLHEQIFNAIHVHDKLLLVLSEHSLKSEWVMTEIRRARKSEREENRRKLFPIKLVDFEAIQKWECFDADSDKDLAVEMREYFIPDFSNWKDHDAFEKSFDRLLRDLKAEDRQTAEG